MNHFFSEKKNNNQPFLELIGIGKDMDCRVPIMLIYD